ncbi:unnamed protein product [Polarella glacialis]|uniref:RING-type domain-containing protein n=1 Tax=Polarella glacialis TaxID=89957 RepID=A0A813LPX2_POLGL|nr:unnamed protein product [Polarella glacialis]
MPGRPETCPVTQSNLAAQLLSFVVVVVVIVVVVCCCSTCRATPTDLCGAIPERPFRLLDNNGDAPAEQPPHFKEHPLRPEQLRSLAWMLAREGYREGGAASGDAPEATAEKAPAAGDGDGDGNGCQRPAGPGGEGWHLISGGSRDYEPFVVEWRRYWSPHQSEDKELDQLVTGAHVVVRLDAAGPFMQMPDGMGLSQQMSCSRAATLKGVDGIITAVCDPAYIVSFTIGHSSLSVRCSPQDLQFTDHGVMKIGSRIMLLPGLKNPAFGWGGVTADMIGILLREDGDVIEVRWPTHPRWKGKKSELCRVETVIPRTDSRPVELDLRVRASYPVRGGILADKIGYGKTATTIALIDRGLGQPLPPVPQVDSGYFIPAKGTLVIVPSNLFDQWLGEISKFVWGGKSLRSHMKGGWSPPGAPMRIFAMSNVLPMSRAKAAEVAEADVVLCSYRLLYSAVYLERRKELCSGGSKLADLAEVTQKLLQRKIMLRSGRKGNTQVNKWQDLEFPVLEMFYWRRIVFDEFHELESFDSLAQNSLQHLRSHFRWGLTGTPPVERNAGGIFMSSLFRIDLPGYLLETGLDKVTGRPNLEPWETDRLLTETTGQFLDAYARQNTAELPHIQLQEHVIVVNHSPAERVLYLGQAHDAPDFASPEAFDTEENVRALERLLKLCSHFQVGGGEAASSAKEECERISDQKERRVVRARNQLRRCCRVIRLLEQMPVFRQKGGKKSGNWRGELGKAEEKIAAESDSGKVACKELAEEEQLVAKEKVDLQLQMLDGHRPRDEELATKVGPSNPQKGGCSQEQWAALATDKSVEAEEVEKFLGLQAKEQAQNLVELNEASASLDFFQRTLKALAADSARPEDRSCTVCMEDNLPLAKLAITPCAHTFCIDCLAATVEKFGHCSICRRTLTKRDVRPLVAELVAELLPQAAPADSTGSTPSSSSTAAAPVDETLQGVRFDKYGAKLAALVSAKQQANNNERDSKLFCCS